jgi:hypothetical protein
MKTMKGQYFSFDAIIASIIFVLALTTLLSYWNGTRNTFDLQNNEMQKEASRISNFLFAPGVPANVDCKKQTQIGFSLSWQDKRMNKTQVKCASGAKLSQNALKGNFTTQFNISIYFDKGTSREKLIGQDITTVPSSRNIVRVHRVASVLNETNLEELSNVDVFVYQ